VWLAHLLKDFDLKKVGIKSKNWSPSVQDAEPHGGFYEIKLYDLKEFFSAVPVGQRETVAGVLFGSIAMVGSQTREGN